MDETINDEFYHPLHKPRTDIVHPSRVQGFSDAVFATAATLLIIPLRRFELQVGETLSEGISRNWFRFVIFLFGYLIICRIWEVRVVRTKVVNKVDDLLVGLTLLSLMVTTFLPFVINLESYYVDYNISALLIALVLLVLYLIEAFILVYSFHNPYLLSDRIQRLNPAELKTEKYQLFIKLIVDSLLLTLAAALSYTSMLASRLLILGVLFTSILLQWLSKIVRCTDHCQLFQNYQSPYKVVTGSIDKERIECFSDAAIAIVATLLILDLTTEDFPTAEQVAENGLEYALGNMWRKFLAYAGTFAVISLLWFVNHSVLHHIKVFTPFMVFINKLFLAFVAAIPFTMTLVENFAEHASPDCTVAVQFSMCGLFLGSLCNVLLLLVAMWQKEVTMYEWAWPKRRGESTRNRVHTYLFLKTLILPLLTLITFFSSLINDYACYVTFYVAVCIVPVVFIFLKLMFACHCRPHHQDNTLFVPRPTSPEANGGLAVDSHISLANRGVFDDNIDSE